MAKSGAELIITLKIGLSSPDNEVNRFAASILANVTKQEEIRELVATTLSECSLALLENVNTSKEIRRQLAHGFKCVIETHSSNIPRTLISRLKDIVCF
jgi:hypothetical protein